MIRCCRIAMNGQGSYREGSSESNELSWSYRVVPRTASILLT
jgi:hypothetical protein